MQIHIIQQISILEDNLSKRKKIKSGSPVFSTLYIFLSVFILYFIQEIHGQQPEQLYHEASNIESSDTLVQEMPEIYQNLKNASGKKKWAQNLYSAVIKEPSAPVVNPGKVTPIEEEYLPYAGKKIRKIEIVVLDPFGTSVHYPDSIHKEGGLGKIANSLHAATKRVVVRNNLQFREGDVVNPIIIAESEVFLRNTGYISDARIYLEPISSSADEVDAFVVVKDVFSIGLSVHKITLSDVDVSLFDKNFFGWGNRINLDLVFSTDYERKFGYGAGYTYTNILHSFIDAGVSFKDDIVSEHFYSSLERPLQTSFKYFGQASYDWYHYRTTVAGWDSVSPNYNTTLSASLGRAFDILPAGSVTRRLVLSARYLESLPSYVGVTPHFEQIPYQFVKRKMVLGQLSIYQQSYLREYLIHSYGITENVAQGYNFSLQMGWNRFLGVSESMYASFSGSAGKQFSSGNYYMEGAVSSYFTPSSAYEGVLKGEFRYFSPLLRIGKSRFRQFFTASYARTLNPVPQVQNLLYYGSVSSLKTANYSSFVNGRERLMLNIESDLFSAINLIGFRFLFYTFGDLGFITPDGKLLRRNKLYGGAGLGIRIRNDLLVFNTIDIRLGYYPRLDQQKINDYLDVLSSTPGVSPDFTPGYPGEIPLE